MDWKTLYMTTAGRIGQKDFWLGWLILIVVNIVLGLVLGMAGLMVGSILKLIVGLVVLYGFYCLLAKRFQDFGKNGKIAAIPCLLIAITQVISLVMVLGLLGGAATGYPDSAAMAGGALAGAGLAGIIGLIGAIIGLVFLFWAGLAKGDPGPNEFGPPPVSLIGGAPTAA